MTSIKSAIFSLLFKCLCSTPLFNIWVEPRCCRKHVQRRRRRTIVKCVNCFYWCPSKCIFPESLDHQSLPSLLEPLGHSNVWSQLSNASCCPSLLSLSFSFPICPSDYISTFFVRGNFIRWTRDPAQHTSAPRPPQSLWPRAGEQHKTLMPWEYEHTCKACCS